jgi:hypothetical protein
MSTDTNSFLLALSKLRRDSGCVNMRNISQEEISAAIDDVSHIKGYLSYIQTQMKDDAYSAVMKYPKIDGVAMKYPKTDNVPTKYQCAAANDATMKDSIKYPSNVSRLEQINAALTAMGVDISRCDDGSDIVRLFLNKRATPKGTMCSNEYRDTTARMYEDIKRAQEKIELKQRMQKANEEVGNTQEERSDKASDLSNHVLRLHQHLTSTRPIDLRRFRQAFESLLSERIAVLAEIRAAEVDGK